MTVAFVFPGEGAQGEGLLHRLPQHVEVARTLEEATRILGFDVGVLDSPRALSSTAGVHLFIEVPPGHVSTRLVEELFPDVRAASIADQGFRVAIVLSTAADRRC